MGGGNDRICGNAKRDTLRGGPGRDRLAGAKLWGDAGNDLLIAGKGPSTRSIQAAATTDCVAPATTVTMSITSTHHAPLT
jgi:hypothetical protein